MVFKPFSQLARQSFGKTLSHGYAQSVVAATQTSYASSTTPFAPFGNHTTNKLGRQSKGQHYASFHNTSDASARASKAGQSAAESKDGEDGGLVAYYEAWQRQQQRGDGEDQDWKQFQFPKRIEWRSPSAVPEGNARRTDATTRPEGIINHRKLGRTYSTSDVDGIKKAQDQAAQAAVVAQVDEAIEDVINEIYQPSSGGAVYQTSINSASQHGDAKAVPADPTRSTTPSSTTAGTVTETSALTNSTAATSPQQDGDSEAFFDYISELHETHAYAQIPQVFEAMLLRNIRPTTQAYNALLASAIHLSTPQHRAIPKALDIHADMLRRKVVPDTIFYTRLIQLLSRRSLDVFELWSKLDHKQKRYGGLIGSGRDMLASKSSGHGALMQDDALNTTMKLFEASTSTQPARHFSTETYRLLITACARYERVDDMVRAYNHMEAHEVKPVATIFPPMIEAFAKIGDLSSALECYNEYRSLAIADDNGKLVIIDRKDNDVYAVLMKAYLSRGRSEEAYHFFDKIVESFGDATEQPKKDRMEIFKDQVIQNAFVQYQLEVGDFSEALKMADKGELSPNARSEAFSRICSAAADNGNTETAAKAYQQLASDSEEANMASFAMLALHSRLGNADVAAAYWKTLIAAPILHTSFVDSASSYAVSLIRNGNVDDGLSQAREAFGRLRASAQSPNLQTEMSERIDEAIESIGIALIDSGVRPSPYGSISFLWAMVENGGLIAPVAEQLLRSFGPESIASLNWQDMLLALQAEACVILSNELSPEAMEVPRFTHLLDITTSSATPLDAQMVDLVDKVIAKLSGRRPDLASKWQNYQQPQLEQAYPQPQYTPLLSPIITSTVPHADTYDPYADSTDYRGSTIIAEELDNHRNSAGLNEALARFKNIRRAGRHPRYIAYAKLITAAAKEGRFNLTHDILGMARSDVPFLPEYPIVRHGWTSILDAMIGASLTAGRRGLAEQHHQELLGMGSAPTANTFGLYITTLKESTKTFDEATEAVAIFNRALSEGVVPSSFLYNALIGKLGKARRIDDCLRYFQEMRASGIRATSVTYGTIVNALCRVSDERFAEELFDEMESMPNYKPRPAPYNSMMQFFLMTKRDSEKVLAYYTRMQSRNIQPTMHTYKLLIDTYATLEPVNLAAAEGILDTIRASGHEPEAVHYASLIHAKGCALRDMAGARQTFDQVLSSGKIRPQACLYQALFESMVANHCVAETEGLLNTMSANRVEMTPYIANTLIHGWAMENQIAKSKAVYDSVGAEKREPSTYESMTRAFLTVEDRESAMATVHEMLSRGYPSAVSGKVLELVGHGASRVGSFIAPGLASA